MGSVFNLQNVEKLVKTHPVKRIVVVDTNVLINEPDFEKWSVTTGGNTIFVLSDTICIELEFIKQKNKDKNNEKNAKVNEAIESLSRINQKGKIIDSIAIK